MAATTFQLGPRRPNQTPAKREDFCGSSATNKPGRQRKIPTDAEGGYAPTVLRNEFLSNALMNSWSNTATQRHRREANPMNPTTDKYSASELHPDRVAELESNERIRSLFRDMGVPSGGFGLINDLGPVGKMLSLGRLLDR